MMLHGSQEGAPADIQDVYKQDGVIPRNVLEVNSLANGPDDRICDQGLDIGSLQSVSNLFQRVPFKNSHLRVFFFFFCALH